MPMLNKPSTCSGCILFGNGQGFVPADGSGRNGVLVVLEAAGEDEAASGLPTVGKAGYYLWSALAKVGLERDDFRIHNVLSCRPPENKLAFMPYERQAIDKCAPNLDATIRDMKDRCRQNNKTFTILTLGKIAFKNIMGIDEKHDILKEDYQCYVHWSDKVGAWVIAADHPSYLMRGNHHLVPILQFAAQRAVEVASEGFRYHEPRYVLDPSPDVFEGLIRDYRRELERAEGEVYLSVDIETPTKQRKSEDKLAREEDDDYIILRCSFAWREGEAISIPWRAEYFPVLEELFQDERNQYVTWNGNYDIPRIKNQLTVRGVNHDAMLAWHVLNSQLDKRLGFVSPFYAKNARMWKHLSGEKPALYNAQDADMALVNYLGIRRDLARVDQLPVFQRHVIQLNKVLDTMSAAGVKRDETTRREAEENLTRLLTECEGRMELAIPQEARRLKVYKKEPASTEGLLQVDGEVSAKQCEGCGKVDVKADHFKSVGKKALKAGAVENPCHGKKAVKVKVPVKLWAKPLEFKASKVQLQSYQAALKHQAVINRKENKVTFDEDAIRSLMRKYPKDSLYPTILEHREIQKLLGTYVGVTQPDGSVQGGLRAGKDGRIHPEYSHNPETLRLACQNPNMQNLPRKGKDGALQNVVRNLVVADEGMMLLEFDYSAIEAVLSAYAARWPDGIRLAKLGVHSYLASHVLKRPVDLSWSDADLAKALKGIKGDPDPEVQRIYNACKRTVHLSNYGGTPRKMVQAEPDTFGTEKFARWLQDTYFDVAGPIRKWQKEIQLEAHQNGFLRNPFGYILRFTHVFRNVKENGQWVKKPGDQANDALAFWPQSTAAGIIKEAMLRLYEYDEIRPLMRLQVHDSLVFEVPLDFVDECARIVKLEMERPVEQLKLPASYKMGDALIIETESKRGLKWGSMR